MSRRIQDCSRGGRRLDLAAQLALANLIQGLAIHALSRGGTGLQAPDADLDTAALAIAILITVDAVQGFAYLLEQLAFAVTGTQFQTEFRFLAGTIVGSGKLAASSCI